MNQTTTAPPVGTEEHVRIWASHPKIAQRKAQANLRYSSKTLTEKGLDALLGWIADCTSSISTAVR